MRSATGGDVLADVCTHLCFGPRGEDEDGHGHGHSIGAAGSPHRAGLCRRLCVDQRWLLLLACVLPVGVALAAPGISRNPWFVAASVAVCGQLAVIAVPRVLWVQFEAPVTWEHLRNDACGRLFLLAVSNVVTVGGLAVCVTVLVGRFHAGDLLSMSTVAEIGSTLFLVKQAQAAIGRPALAIGRAHAARSAAARFADLEARPHLTPTLWRSSPLAVGHGAVAPAAPASPDPWQRADGPVDTAHAHIRAPTPV